MEKQKSNILYYIFFSVIGQRTNPPELPIYGDPLSDIALELVFPKGKPIFMLSGKSLQLLQPLDRDEENLSHIVFQVKHF